MSRNRKARKVISGGGNIPRAMPKGRQKYIYTSKILSNSSLRGIRFLFFSDFALQGTLAMSRSKFSCHDVGSATSL